MSKMKRAVALALAAVMTVGSTLTVFAAEEPVTTGTSGKGENEGHVDKELINVILPTVPATDGSPFEYVTDPERLIQETAGARYEDYTFPAKDNDTGVYFRVGEKEFANTSETLQVINKSSCDMKITVKAKATASDGGKDLKLASDNTFSGDTQLFLNLNVGQTKQTISATEASVDKTIAGNPNNFEVQYDGSAYKYVAKDTAVAWKAIDISLNGEVFNGTVEADTTAPTVDVTWAFAKAGDSDTVATDQVDYEDPSEPGIISISNYVKKDPKRILVQFTVGSGAHKVDADGALVYGGTNKAAFNVAKYTVNMGDGTISIDNAIGTIANATADVPIWVVLTKGGKEVKELTGTICVSEDYPQAPGIVSVTALNKSAPERIIVTFTLGTGSKAIDADGATVYAGANRAALNVAKYTVNIADGTISIDNTIGTIANATTDVPIYVVFTKGGEEVKEFTGTIKVIN